jgi:hypothetical protein
MNWTAILSAASIPEPPGRTDTVAQAIARHQSQVQAAAAAITSKRTTATTRQ